MRSITDYLNEKLESTQQTPANNAEPKMSISVSRARTTVMDSDYWTVETIRTGDNLGDVSLAPRRNIPHGSPNRIYEIHVDNGIVATAIREYPDKLEQGWKEQFILGEGLSVAIAFNGYWSRYRNLWRLVTGEKPWIFWVDENNVLWRQYWDDEATKVQHAVDVMKVTALRAWKNVNLPDHDQGIVVGFVKTDGTVWYKNYCQQVDYTYAWESERQLSEFTCSAINLNLFITNDYRMGFAIEDTLHQIYWIITPRNWSGMALEQHVLVARGEGLTKFIAINYIGGYSDEHLEINLSQNISMLFGATDNSLVGAENRPIIRLDEFGEEYQDWGFIVRVQLNYFAINTPSVILRDVDADVAISIDHIEEVVETDGFQFDIYINDLIAEFGMNTVLGNIRVTVQGGINEAGYTYPNMIYEFTPSNLVFPDLPLPEVEAIWNE